MNAADTHHFAVEDYDLAATLDCGQAFRWRQRDDGWHGIIGGRWVRLQQCKDGILAQTIRPPADWDWLAEYLQTTAEYRAMLDALPTDAHLQAAIRTHHGLRLLRQPPWECLASFILSSTKQIVQIRQIIELLSERFGDSVEGPNGISGSAFPDAARVARLSESDLRACKMGFRAPHLLGAARAVASGELDLDQMRHLPHAEVRRRLMGLPGVGEKIAACVLLFAYGHADAFPIDVWVARALRQYYFRGRNVSLARLREFAAGRWRRGGGYAQQYLFHYIRTQTRKTARASGTRG